jgi:hypothetical protein
VLRVLVAYAERRGAGELPVPASCLPRAATPGEHVTVFDPAGSTFQAVVTRSTATATYLDVAWGAGGITMGYDPELIEAFVVESCRAQGVPVKMTDPAVRAQVSVLLWGTIAPLRG